MVISIWNCFSIPVDIAFEPEIFQDLANTVINHCIDSMFAIDILLNFRTTIVDDLTGLEIINEGLIAK